MTSTVQIFRESESNKALAKALHAKTFFSRLRGLLGRAPLRSDQGLLLSPCNQVHTFGMGYSLDIVYLDNKGVVLKCVENLKPLRVSHARGAKHVLELAAHTVCKCRLEPGEKLIWY